MYRKLFYFIAVTALILFAAGCGGREMTDGDIDAQTTIGKDTTVNADTIIHYDTTIHRDTLITDTVINRERRQETIEMQGVDTLSGEEEPEGTEEESEGMEETETDTAESENDGFF